MTRKLLKTQLIAKPNERRRASQTIPEHAELARRGQEIYDTRLKAILEPKHNGMFVAIDARTGDYAMGANAFEAGDVLRQRRPKVVSFLIRVGANAAYRLG